MSEPLLDKDQLAIRLNVPPSWVRNAITARSIPITWIGRHARFSEDDVEQILAAGKKQSAGVARAVRLPQSTRRRRRTAA